MNTTTTTNPFSLPLPASAPASARSGLRLLQRLQHGTLHLELPDGSTLQVGQGAGQGGYPHASLHLHHWRVFGAVLRSGDIGLAEATAVWWQNIPDAMLATKTWSISLRRERNPASWRQSVAA